MKKLPSYLIFFYLLALSVACSTLSKTNRMGKDMNKAFLSMEIYSSSYTAYESLGAVVEEVMIIDCASKSYDWYCSEWSPLSGEYTETTHVHGGYIEHGDTLFWKPQCVYTGEFIVPVDSIPLISRFNYGDFGIQTSDELHLQFDDGTGFKQVMKKRLK